MHKQSGRLRTQSRSLPLAVSVTRAAKSARLGLVQFVLKAGPLLRLSRALSQSERE